MYIVLQKEAVDLFKCYWENCSRMNQNESIE